MSYRIAAIATISLATSGCGSIFYAGQQPSATYRSINSHMSEDIRGTVHSVALRPSSFKPTVNVAGDFQKLVPTAGQGAKTGAGAGVEVTGEMIAEDPRAIILAPIILPVAVLTGAITGAAAAKIQQQIQKTRDKLTVELTENPNPQLGAETLVESMHTHLENLDIIESTLVEQDSPMPDGIDSILQVGLTDFTILVDGKDASMITTVTAILRRTSDGRIIYDESFYYRVSDSLNNWAENDYALWEQYIENARRHFTGAVTDVVFSGVLLRHVLRPTNSVDRWKKTVTTPTPTLSWELILLGDDDYDGTWANELDESNVTYELNIYDGDRLVYAANDISGTRHQVQDLAGVCQTLNWSVRPHYQVNGNTRTGEWMRHVKGIRRQLAPAIGSTATETPDFWEGFPQLTIRC